MTASQDDIEIAALAALRAGDAGPVAGLFGRSQGQRSAILKSLLRESMDGAVAQAFNLIWQEIDAEVSDHWTNLLRWYLVAEAKVAFPARRACHRAILGRVVQKQSLFKGAEGIDLALAAARLALEHGGEPGLRAAGDRLLRRLDLTALPLTPAMIHAAIQGLDLSLLHPMIARGPEGPINPDLKSALDWAMGLVLEFEGLGPRIEAQLNRRFRLDPTEPLATQRQVQIGLHHGKGFAALTAPLAAMRRDPRDPNLAKVLSFAYWQARMIGDERLTQGFQAELVALDPHWTDSLPEAAPAAMQAPSGGDLAALVQEALALAQADWKLDSAWEPQNLSQAFADLGRSMSGAPLPPGWGPQRLLEAAQALLQISRREYSWCNHFDTTPHATGQARYGMVKLRLIPVLQDGLMVLIAALCRRGVEIFLQDDPDIGLAPLARLLQLYCRATLEVDQAEAAKALLDRLSEAGLIADIVALERDALALNRGWLDVAAPAARKDSTIHAFLNHAIWSRAEGIAWSEVARDASVTGSFDVVWPDGRVETAAHHTPRGQVSQASVPGLRLIPEDFLIGPGGSVLRPDPYHTSREFPWPSPWMVASGQRAIRLRPASWTRQPEPVLVLEGFEALRWRNYYHWLVPMLSRIALAKEHGLLDQRRLVVPEGLSSWMRHSLDLLGLDEGRLLTLPPGHGQEFDDALVLASVEHVSPAGIAALRRGLMGRAAEVVGPPDQGPMLFLSRKSHGLRMLVNQDEVEAIAADLGFEVLAPEELGIPGQIALFARARGVAAVEGAALTNTIFAPPGIGVLAIVCENEMMPIFNDLSIVLGQRHRKLAGQPRPVPGKGNRLQPPFHVDPALARTALQWVLDQVSNPKEAAR